MWIKLFETAVMAYCSPVPVGSLGPSTLDPSDNRPTAALISLVADNLDPTRFSTPYLLLSLAKAVDFRPLWKKHHFKYKTRQ